MRSTSADNVPSRDLDTLDRLGHAIELAAHLLPAQGPISVFIHHNTLHAFEDLPFDEAVRRGAEVFGCQPYLSEDQFREALGRGRIRFNDLRAVLEDDLGDRSGNRVPPRSTTMELRLAMLQNNLPAGTADELRWVMEETDSLRKVRPGTSAADRAHLIAETRRWAMRDLRAWDGADWAVPKWVPDLFAKFLEAGIETWSEVTWEAFSLEALWGICRDGVDKAPARSTALVPLVRHRDLLRRITSVDTDLWVHGIMIRFCAAFLDQGVSHWSLPDRDRGFLHAFCSVYRGSVAPPDRWFGGVPAELARLQDAGVGPLEALAQSLAELGVGEAEWGEYLSATLLGLPGWGGMIHESEVRADRFAFPSPANSLIGFLAVRLLLERFALAHAARENLRYDGPLNGLRDVLRTRLHPPASPGVLERVLPVFFLAQTLGWTPDELHELSADEWAALVSEVEAFDSVERRRVFHLAYERRFREQTLDALAIHLPRRIAEVGFRVTETKAEAGADETNPVAHNSASPQSAIRSPQSGIRPRFQVITCLDEREESFRRHLEEVSPDCETFGTAGFFAVAMYYRGVAEAHYIPLCPVVIRPKHWVEERPDQAQADQDRLARRVRRALGRTSHQIHVGTRGFAMAAVITGGLGVLATLPLVARVLFPD